MKLYNEKAEVYESFIAATGKDYKDEAEKIAGLIKKETSKKNLFDLGCGTGRHALELKKKGFNVICGDISEAMVRKAQTKGLEALRTDMRSFTLAKKVDIITCLFNTIMYNKNEKELESTFKSCFNNLNKQGILIIQITDPELLKIARPYSQRWCTDNHYEVVQECILDYPRFIHKFTIKNLKTGSTTTDIHNTRIFSLDAIKSALTDQGFQQPNIIRDGATVYMIARI